MKTMGRFLIAFLAITGGVALATGFLDLEFGRSDYWDDHGIFFLIFLTAFPRLTLLFTGPWTGGLLWWASWVFAPRILVAVLATLAYWNQNPILVICAWLVALGGESSEKYVMVQRSPWGGEGKGFESAKWVRVEKD